MSKQTISYPDFGQLGLRVGAVLGVEPKKMMGKVTLLVPQSKVPAGTGVE